MTAAKFVILNDTHHAALLSLAEIFNIIPKDAKKQITDIHNGRCSGVQEFSFVPKQVSAPMTYQNPTIQCRQQKSAPRLKAKNNKTLVDLQG